MHSILFNLGDKTIYQYVCSTKYCRAGNIAGIYRLYCENILSVLVIICHNLEVAKTGRFLKEIFFFIVQTRKGLKIATDRSAHAFS